MSPSIGLVAATAAGRQITQRLATALGERATVVDEPAAADGLRHAWREHRAVVAVLATGAVVRVLAPLIAAGQKSRDPAVITIDEAGRFVTSVLGGHAAGGNRLAEELAELLGGVAVVTTATDSTGLPGLDDLGWPVEGDVAGVTRRLLDGAQLRICAQQRWPLPALGANTTMHVGSPCAGADVVITDRTDVCGQVTLRPPSLVAGMGASRGVSADEAQALLHDTLTDAGLSLGSVAAIATAEIKADEPGLVELARRLGIALVTHPGSALDRVPVPNPSAVVRAAVGVSSVAEAAALLGVHRRPGELRLGELGPGELAPGELRLGELVVPKRASAMATVAIARHAPRGRLAIIGLGPGSPALLTPAARTELRRAQVLVGLDQYVEQIRSLLRPGTEVLSSALGAEDERAHSAVERARAGHAVALIGSGDAGVYAMASPALEIADDSIDVVSVPGVTAALAASAILGAPLGHDHCYLSLSDLHTPWEIIERRVRAVAEADLVLVCYNPRSVARSWQLDRALAVLADHRPPETPVGVVRNATRPDQSSTIATLAGFDSTAVDMYSLVIVGSTRTRMVAGRMVTPRGYRWTS